MAFDWPRNPIILTLAARNAALEASYRELLEAHREQGALIGELLQQQEMLQRQVSVLLAEQEESVAASR